MNKVVFIEGEKINLCVIEKEFADGNYKDWFNNEEVCFGNAHYKYPTSIQDLRDYIDSKSTESIRLAIVDKISNEHIGNVALQRIDGINRSAEFAVIIGEKKSWGKGVGKEAAYLIFKHGFNYLNLNRIYLGTFETNFGMIKIAEALNMKKEGCRRKAVYKNGTYLDVVEFGILKDEFKT